MSVVFAFLVCLELSSGKSKFEFLSLWTEGFSCSPQLENERATLPGNQLSLTGQVQKEFHG